MVICAIIRNAIFRASARTCPRIVRIRLYELHTDANYVCYCPFSGFLVNFVDVRLKYETMPITLEYDERF